jgi:predicted RNase H-like nuclease
MLKNIDFIDAALCAVAALYVHSNKFDRYGDAREGFIVIPAMGR